MKFCKKCGTLYDDKNMECPKCAAEALEPAPPAEMTEAELTAARKRDWIWILIGVPAFMGFIYLIYYILRMLKGA